MIQIQSCPSLAGAAIDVEALLKFCKLDAVWGGELGKLGSKLFASRMKLWTAVCYLLEEKRMQDSSGVPSGQESPSSDMAYLIDALFNSLSTQGSTFCGVTFANDEEGIYLRETSAICIFQLLRIRGVGRNLSVGQWHTLGWTLIDPMPSVRRSLMGALNMLIQTHAVHPKILSLSCLLANDDTLRVSAENALMFAVRRLRRTHQSICDKALKTADEDLKKLAEDNMPETILPYVLHLLSHHPEFPSSAAIDDELDRKRMKSVVRSLTMVLNVLLDSVSSEGDNLSYLFKQVHMITRYYTDRIDSGNLGLDFVTRVTRKILNERIRAAENVQSYPGDVCLPMDLYELCEDDHIGVERNAAAAESAVDHALQVVGLKKQKRKPGHGDVSRKITKPRVEKREAATTAKSLSSKARTIVNESDEEGEDRIDKSTVEPVKRLVSSRSRRIVRAVRYVEAEENEDEVERWNAEAGEASREKFKRKSIAPASISGRESNKSNQENIFDFSDHNRDKRIQGDKIKGVQKDL